MSQQPTKTGASVQQPQSPPTTARTPALEQVDLLMFEFSKCMSNEQLALWLRNHPSLSGTDYEEDISKLRGTLPNTVVINNNIMVVKNFNRCQT